MGRELEFDGWWEGTAVYFCDCCHKTFRIRFESQDEVNSKSNRVELRKNGWISTKVNDQWKDFCTEQCRNKYIRTQTI